MDRAQPPHITRKPLRWTLFWIGYFAGFAVFDGWRASKRDGSTLSEVTRHVFNTHTTHGKVAFASALAAGAICLAGHILKNVTQ